MTALLEVQDVSVHYGRLAAVREVSLHLMPQEIVCVVGPNGAGKSTLLLSIVGALKSVAGSIRLDGAELVGRSIEAIARSGLSLVPEGRHVFAGLTVEENLRIGMTMRRDRTKALQDFQMVLDAFPILASRLRSGAGKLSGGEQQQLVIARALLSKPRIMLIDEPSLGLAPMIIDKVYDILEGLRQEGLTIPVVEQSTERALSAADRIYVMRSGQIVLHGNAEELAGGREAEEAYFGFHAS